MSDDHDHHNSFDPKWLTSINLASEETLRERVNDLVSWARSRIGHLDRLLSAGVPSITTTNPYINPLIYRTERVMLVAVLTQLAGDDR